MRTIHSTLAATMAVAATMLLISPLGAAPSPASAGLAAGKLGAAVPQTENSAIIEVAQNRRVRYERRMRQERKVRYERRAVRRCIRQGYCPVVYVQVPVYYYVPVWYTVPVYF